ncbi:MAG: IPT/TIG domain-containing protein [Candidatus Melainabacteria bacterium]|jgi:hypothetical protein|nr:IPT/TIG domain-containing protein [Candidatus Melainabacteria bacterium]
MANPRIFCILAGIVSAYGQPVSALENMAILQESKPLVTRAGAWHTWGDRIHLNAQQAKLPLELRFANGADNRPAATDLKVELDHKPVASFANFNGGKSFSLDLSGKLRAGSTHLTVKGLGPSGARMNWKLYIQRPVITAVTPDPVGLADTISIKGRNFSSNAQDIRIHIAGKHIKPTSASEGELKFKLPANADGGSHHVVVSVAHVNSAPYKVNVRSGPRITFVDMLSSPPTQHVTIMGSGFSPVASENTVTFRDVKANVVSATESSIIVAVPDIHFPDWYVPIKVVTNGMPSHGKAHIHIDVRVIPNEGIPMH